jgi:hypothetical protein
VNPLARLLLLMLVAACTAALAQTSELPAAFWDRQRTAAIVLSQENVKGIAVAALAQPDARVVIHHAPGQEPQIQAEELRSWLGALAIDTRRIVLRNDLGTGSSIKMEVIP